MNIEDFTKHRVDEEGTYRAFPVEWALKEYDSRSVSLNIKLAISRRWHGQELGWSEEWPIGHYVEHQAWVLVVPKDKDKKPIPGAAPVLREKTITSLNECGLWDGDFDKVDGPPPKVFVLADVSMQTYQGEPRFKADWVNPDAEVPKLRGAYAPTDRGLLDRLKATHQAKARALTAGSGGASMGVAPTPPAPPGVPSTPVVPQLPADPAMNAAWTTNPDPSVAAPAAPAPPAAPTTASPGQPPAWGGQPPATPAPAPGAPAAPGDLSPPPPPAVSPGPPAVDGEEVPF